MNHTDVPHTMSMSERDVLHETNSSIGIEDGVASKMLIMNCKHSERPEYAKKRYFFIMSLFGVSWLYRNALRKRLYQTTFNVEKHIESIDGQPL